MKTEFYDGTKLLSLQDLNGNKPEIFICTSNRSAGKTTFFSKYFVKKFIQHGEKFGLIYRYNYELDDVADKFFKDIGLLFFPQYHMRSERKANGIYHELFLCNKYDEEDTGISCGYAITLNSADALKKYSHLLSDITRLMMDEFQSETNRYCDKEIIKFQSVHTSLARGNGEQSKYLPVFLIGNPVSIINPYYTALGISARLKGDTKFLRGIGFVLEQGFNKSASIAQQESVFNQAFNSANSSSYLAYSSQNIYLNDNKSFIEKPTGVGKYICTIKYMNNEYALREFNEAGIVYCDDRVDSTFKFKISVTTEDHQINYVILKNNDILIYNMRYYFERGCFRFKDLRCKEAIMKLISY